MKTRRIALKTQESRSCEGDSGGVLSSPGGAEQDGSELANTTSKHRERAGLAGATGCARGVCVSAVVLLGKGPLGVFHGDSNRSVPGVAAVREEQSLSVGIVLDDAGIGRAALRSWCGIRVGVRI